MQNVTIEWEDGRITTESFKNEDDFFSYLDETKKETGIGTNDFYTEPKNGDWSF